MVCQSIRAAAERRRVGGFQEQAGAPDAASDGLRAGQTLAVREAQPPRRNSGLSVRLLRCLAASVVVPVMALVTERLSPEDLALPVGRAATRRAARHFGELTGRRQISAMLTGFFTTASGLIRP